MDRIWPAAIVTENTLHVHTMAVRKALGPYRSLLKTESRRGYRHRRAAPTHAATCHRPRPIDEAELHRLASLCLDDEHIAAGLGLSLRQYQRRVSYATGLRQIVDQARKEAAIKYLQRLRQLSNEGNAVATWKLLESVRALVRPDEKARRNRQAR